MDSEVRKLCWFSLDSEVQYCSTRSTVSDEYLRQLTVPYTVSVSGKGVVQGPMRETTRLLHDGSQWRGGPWAM